MKITASIEISWTNCLLAGHANIGKSADPRPLQLFNDHVWDIDSENLFFMHIRANCFLDTRDTETLTAAHREIPQAWPLESGATSLPVLAV